MPQSAAAAVVGHSADAAEKLIVALDVGSVTEAREIVDQLEGTVSFFKIGIALQWEEGLRRFIDELLNGRGCQVFLDYKYGDIGSTLRRGIAGVANLGVNFLTIQGAGDVGEKDLRLAITARDKGQRLKIFLVTVLTRLDQHDLDELLVHAPPPSLLFRPAPLSPPSPLPLLISSFQ